MPRQNKRSHYYNYKWNTQILEDYNPPAEVLWRLRNPSTTRKPDKPNDIWRSTPVQTSFRIPNVGRSTVELDFNSQAASQEKGANRWGRYRDADPTYGGRVDPEEQKKRRKLFED